MLSNLEILLVLYFPEAYNHRQPEESPPRRRLASKRYLAKKEIVKAIWIASGTMMILFPLLPFMVTLGLFTTFLSFTILDETP